MRMESVTGVVDSTVMWRCSVCAYAEKPSCRAHISGETIGTLPRGERLKVAAIMLALDNRYITGRICLKSPPTRTRSFPPNGMSLLCKSRREMSKDSICASSVLHPK
eukprot:GHVS01072124.1.p1 GENE.GHVS01072124.1~~GHVS01072124.1.p1  ORF type:complete len:107 (-),score=3.38 GHVS01072124.1:206-526(-)